jgi:hypothetical protein
LFQTLGGFFACEANGIEDEAIGRSDAFLFLDELLVLSLRNSFGLPFRVGAVSLNLLGHAKISESQSWGTEEGCHDVKSTSLTSASSELLVV